MDSLTGGALIVAIKLFALTGGPHFKGYISEEIKKIKIKLLILQVE